MTRDELLSAIRARRYGLLRAVAGLPRSLPADVLHGLDALRDPLARLFAVSLVRAQDAPDAPAALSVLACDPSADVGRAAAEALGAIDHRPPSRALSELAARCPHPQARAALYAAAGDGTPDDAAALAHALAGERDRSAYTAGLASLARLRAPGAREHLFLWALHATPERARELADAVARAGDRGMLRAALPWLASREVTAVVPLPDGAVALRMCDEGVWLCLRAGLRVSGAPRPALDRYPDAVVAATRDALSAVPPEPYERAQPPQALDLIARASRP